MKNQITSVEQKQALEKMKKIIYLQFRDFRECKYTSRHLYKSIILNYARYIVSKKGRQELIIEKDDVQSFLIDLILNNRSQRYINTVLSALRYYVRKTCGKDSKTLQQLENIRLTELYKEGEQ